MLSYRSEASFLSICSQGSILSVGSIGSIASVGSIGAVLSVGSIGSWMSAMSMLSSQSNCSILSSQSNCSILSRRSRSPGPSSTRCPPHWLRTDHKNADGQLAARRTWLTPILLIVALAAMLPAVYLAGTADPKGHLSNKPVGLVIERQIGDADHGAAESVATAIEGGTAAALAVTRMSRNELSVAMREDQFAGSVVMPAGFDDSITRLLAGTDDATVPTIALLTNAGGSDLMVGDLSPGALRP